MEYSIKKNEYVKPTEVRKEVVQRLIDIYTANIHTCWSFFCPNQCWRRTYAIGKSREGKWEIIREGTQCKDKYTDITNIRTCEMKEFFKVWLSAGYYISKGYDSIRNQTAILYEFTEKPYTDYGFKLVTEFTEDID